MSYISIIIPAYNEENKIKDTLESIKDIKEIDEIIVVDDGSSDKTSEVAKSVESQKINVITQSKNRGKGYALNNGIREAGVFLTVKQHQKKVHAELISMISGLPVVKYVEEV